MYSIMKQGGKEAAHYIEYAIDTADEVNTLPTDCAVGSIAIIVNESRVFMLNNKKEWVELQ